MRGCSAWASTASSRQGPVPSAARPRSGPTWSALARRRAGNPPLAEIVLVGDTPRDVAGAHEAGIRAIAVATGEYGPTELTDADHVLGALSELPNTLG